MVRPGYCLTVLQGGICTDNACSRRHDVLRCDPCKCSFPPSSFRQHQSGKQHRLNVALNGSPNPGTSPQSPPCQSTPSNPQSATPSNLPPSEGNTSTLDMDPRVTVSGQDGLDFIVEGSGTGEHPSFSSTSQTIVIEKTDVSSSVSVLSLALSPPTSFFTASLVGDLSVVRQRKPRKILVSFQPSRLGTFHVTLSITLGNKTQPNEPEITLTRELRGRAILPGSSADNGDAPNGVEVTAGGEGTGITVSHDFGLEFTVGWPPSHEKFAPQTKELIITKSSPNPPVSFKAARILSSDDPMSVSFSARLEGDFTTIKPKERHIVALSFTPRREGLCEATLELTFHNHNRKTDFVVKRTLNGWTKRLTSGQGHQQNGTAPALRPQPIDNLGDDDASDASDEDEELWDSEGTGISVSNEDGLDFAIVERKRPNGPFATPESSLTIKLEDGFPAATFLNERIKTLDGSDSCFVATFEGDSHTIQPGTENTVHVVFSPKFEGLFKAILELVFYDTQREARFVVRRKLRGIAGSVEDHKLFESFDGEEDEKSSKDHRYIPPQRVVLLWDPGRRGKSRKIPDYEVPPMVKEAVENSSAKRPYDKKASLLVTLLKPSKLTIETYVKWFNSLLQIEDGHQQYLSQLFPIV
ncbi:hypothetical protein F5148DRAFT_514946 [Russula earlei]|uniref:Uncharacterized protein n=1 Tax=Russula earlei TaxID=71964 RepID=A0ACC0TYK9_9AGAM|nr:hypothetical protein F5148DRAFT_514946 [Russula earlei]